MCGKLALTLLSLQFYLLVRLQGRKTSALNYLQPLGTAYSLQRESDSLRKTKLAQVKFVKVDVSSRFWKEVAIHWFILKTSGNRGKNSISEICKEQPKLQLYMVDEGKKKQVRSFTLDFYTANIFLSDYVCQCVLICM